MSNDIIEIGRKPVKTIISFFLMSGQRLIIGVAEPQDIVQKKLNVLLEKETGGVFSATFVQGKEYMDDNDIEFLSLPRNMIAYAVCAEATTNRILVAKDLPRNMQGPNVPNN